ncbi:13131_t:CDS:2 [Ambispora leptoticha]|uniref:13131_t:CDS:1 n=1 Tax=Ambispora leptoticha TaxID=144679 RepID=A0A9N9I1J8_9GLOM|nr:13131_t:CDS:2 [Ambispora leptoticha]
MGDTELASTKAYNNMNKIVFIIGIFLISILASVPSSLAYPTLRDTLSNTSIIIISESRVSHLVSNYNINNNAEKDLYKKTKRDSIRENDSVAPENSDTSNSSLGSDSTEDSDLNESKVKDELVIVKIAGEPENQNNDTSLANQPEQNDQYRESAVRGNDYIQFYVVTISGLSAASISQSSNLYMLYRILSRPGWYDSWNHRFPFYLAVQDTFFNLNMIAEWVEILSTEKFPETLVCKIQGGFLNFSIAWNVMLVTSTAITAYIKVYRERQVNFGRFDWKFHFVCLTTPCLIIGAGMLSDAYGTSTYWCQINVASLSGRINMLALSGIIIICTFITAYCYIKVITKIKASLAKLQSMRNNTFPTNPTALQNRYSAYSSTGVADSNSRFSAFYQARKNSVTTLRSNNRMAHDRTFGWEDEAIGKMSSYILVFVCQWGPGILAYILIFNGCNNIISNTTMVLFVHLGGFFNAIVYLRQHGYFSPRIRPERSASPNDSFMKTSPSPQDSLKISKVPSNRTSLCVPGTGSTNSKGREHLSTDEPELNITVEIEL